MAKRYRIEKEPHFGLDRVIVGPGVYEVIAPETKAAVKELGVLGLLEGAYDAGRAEEKLRVRSKHRKLMEEVIAAVGVPGLPKVTLVDVATTRERLSAIARQFDEQVTEAPQAGAPSPSEGTHPAGPVKTN